MLGISTRNVNHLIIGCQKNRIVKQARKPLLTHQATIIQPHLHIFRSTCVHLWNENPSPSISDHQHAYRFQSGFRAGWGEEAGSCYGVSPIRG